MTAPSHDDLVSAHWTALLELDRQPADMRGCYDILAACVRDLRHPPRSETDRLSLQGQARLGYWIELALGLMHQSVRRSCPTLGVDARHGSVKAEADHRARGVLSPTSHLDPADQPVCRSQVGPR